MTQARHRTLSLQEYLHWFRSSQNDFQTLVRQVQQLDKVERDRLASGDFYNLVALDSVISLRAIADQVEKIRDVLQRGVSVLTPAYPEPPYAPVIRVQPSIGHTSFKLTANHSASDRGRIEAIGVKGLGIETVGPFAYGVVRPGDVFRVSGSKTSGNNGFHEVHALISDRIVEFTETLSSSETSDPGVTLTLQSRLFTT